VNRRAAQAGGGADDLPAPVDDDHVFPRSWCIRFAHREPAHFVMRHARREDAAQRDRNDDHRHHRRQQLPADARHTNL